MNITKIQLLTIKCWPWDTFTLNLFSVEIDGDPEYSLLEIGWVDSSFTWDLLYIQALLMAIGNWKDNRNIFL